MTVELCLGGVELLEGAQRHRPGLRRPMGAAQQSRADRVSPLCGARGEHVLVGGLGGRWPPTRG